MINKENQSYFSPNYIFIRCLGEMTDKEILSRLGLEEFEYLNGNQADTNNDFDKRFVYITEDETWLHIMDDWSYTMWFDKEIRNRMRLLSEDFDVFTCSMGDIDDSYDFCLFKRGKVIRQYIVEDPQYNGGQVIKDLGVAFPIEKHVLLKKDRLDKLLTIARYLGIDVNHEGKELRVYWRFEKKSEKFLFNEDEY